MTRSASLPPAAWVLCTTCLMAASPGHASDPAAGDEELTEITVEASRVANDAPAGTYPSPATALRFDPLTELQSRGIAEGQADVTVRGGLFENTGFRLGVATVFDPQTGHYVAELPVDPAWLGAPRIVHGIDNALTGFNSNIATVSYAFARWAAGGELAAGLGSDGLNHQSLRTAVELADTTDARHVAAVSLARSSGDGTVANGDHRFARANLGYQRQGVASQSEVVLAYQDKFYGWPGAYTGFANLAETDDTKTLFAFVNHRQDIAAGYWQASAYYRELENDYDFDRTTAETGVPGAFEHKTRAAAAAVEAAVERGRVNWRFAAQATADDLVRSTDLTEGFFNNRSYFTVSLVPEIALYEAAGRSVSLRIGAAADVSSRDDDELLPQIGIRAARFAGGVEEAVSLEFASTSQVPGYTVLNSRPAGLFGGNPNLGRERADQLALTLSRESGSAQASVALFRREDRDLVDWTFTTGAPFARQANPVDLDVSGVELLGSLSLDKLRLAAGYTWLDKDSDYGDAAVDASYYALNFARHRATLALIYAPVDTVEIRLDNEYRVQEDNPLRASGDEAYFGSLALRWTPAAVGGVALALTVDNIADTDFESFPGTPAARRQYALSAAWRW